VQFRPNADGHIFLLHHEEIEPLAGQAGLSMVETRLFTNPLTFGHLGTERWLRLLPRGWVDGWERLGQLLPLWLRRRWLSCFAVLLHRPVAL
jgi:2-polyprenyl-6-hydroxyphenyl methylase/3-demethylubiquinone-9 3-methyltransferase